MFRYIENHPVLTCWCVGVASFSVGTGISEGMGEGFTLFGMLALITGFFLWITD